MSDILELPEPDRVEGAPHPRETPLLTGQDAAERGFLDAYTGGRLHHAWLITGPRGVGKATLAWRIARFLLATPPADDAGLFGAPPTPTSLDIDPEHPVMRRSMQLAEPGLFLLRRGPNDKGDKRSADIRVNEVRRLREFFGLSASAEGGRRVVIVDAADEMNTQAANALLKMLEEPPKGATLLLVSHQPSRLLPTIRSRCRELRLSPLSPPDLAQALEAAGTPPGPDTEALGELAGGSVGEALRLINIGGLAIYADLIAIFSHAPRYDRPRAIALAQSAPGAANATRYALILDLIDLFLTRLARAGAGRPPLVEAAPGETALFARLAPHPGAARRWAELAQTISARAGHGRAVNLDPAALILDIVFKINETAAAQAA
ncbi:DNA polymerase III subunit delta' [Maritimibacter sp. UBA3975]|uniref:DNA polymerase III subunit delta' n=1 Tax=Maritimibacter sp. UBA3975 TaxID=1946833 RepID=UPI000C0A76DD|nr:DNA polymerase III subunit delta' [Maritimibacter sp. UBA3975]MAM60649.1 DNA polymerase III subunit delta' [Maritimibacter sp.]|tara:strand:+ start:2372 stop:3505 length:1134 start_codon:yes stop_codon:yes gene_type:complete